ncbi:putative glutathione S-transferase [Didymella exigua CBS 183.55]|uniref:Putative glutathione S-transferase n=1 Tax=Didymella exigua CBS 183.55 TaxID=1150837 RepID=A0A6A5RKM2_9PLEO|nr:putative glutathione S-transferase [Didymella exigua CBS 183.55]KAF1928332.1 putative glutathione S-transferase [Didymella exigua CBS 183.55]
MTTPNLTVNHLQIGQGERIPWLLEELNIPYNLVNYKRSPMLSPPDLKAKHTLGASPVLEDTTDPSNPITLAESGAIVEYIIGKYADGKLALGPSHKNFADYLYWFHFSNSTLQPVIFRRAMLRGAIPNSATDPRYLGADGRVKIALNHMNTRLLSNDWLAGDDFTAADVMTGWCVTTMRVFEPIDLTEYEGILAWIKRFSGRQAWKTAMGKSDPDLNLEETTSVKGPAPIELFAKAMAGKI